MSVMTNAQQIPSELWLSAAERLVAAPGEKAAAKRLIANAKDHNIDLNHLWGVIDTAPHSKRLVRQVCLAVIGSGKTAMLFLSAPRSIPKLGSTDTQVQEIAESIRAALDGLPEVAPGRATLAQTLLETEKLWGAEACERAGMTFVGRLEYLRRKSTQADAESPTLDYLDGISISTISDPMDFSPSGDGSRLAEALEASYIDTLDCPELCGLRSTSDVIESHQSAGVFDPNHWYLIEQQGAPVGCCLFTFTPEYKSAELVYVGLAPSVRGLGLGKLVLSNAMRELRASGVEEITCAVDTRNTPALRIYESMDFRAFDARLGYIAAL